MRNQPPPDDSDIRRLLNSPAEVGRKRVLVGDMCVRRYRDRQHRPEPAWRVKLRLRQLLETGRYRASPPAWVPSDLPTWDGYVELKGGDELVGLTRDRERPAELQRRDLVSPRVPGLDGRARHRGRPPGRHPHRARHPHVTQYVDRIADECGLDAARAELRAVIGCGRVLPEAPTWFDDYTYGGVPAYWLIVNDWLVLPLEPSSRPCPDMYIAVTCLHRDMPRNIADLPELKARLHRESVRLHREEILSQAAARKAA